MNCTTRRISAGACLLFVSFLLALPAGAHDGAGTISVESSVPTDNAAEIVVRLVWNNDGHPAADATITAVPVGVDGATPVLMEPVDSDGRYRANVSLPGPGEWTIRFTSVTPVATLDQPQNIAAETTTTTAPEAASTTEGSTTDDTPTTPALEATTGTEQEPATEVASPASTPASGDSEGSSSGAGAAVLVGVVVVLAGGAALLVIRSRRGAGTT